MAQQKGLINDDIMNTKIIIYNIFSWAKSLSMALIYSSANSASARPTGFY
jgi:hypothetical protein